MSTTATAPVETSDVIPEGLPYAGHDLKRMSSRTLLKISVHPACPADFLTRVREVIQAKLLEREPHWDEPPAA